MYIGLGHFAVLQKLTTLYIDCTLKKKCVVKIAEIVQRKQI